jgi:hypothetical protein
MASSACLKYSGKTPGNIGDKDRLCHNFFIGWIWGSIALLAWRLLFTIVIQKNSSCLSRVPGDTNSRDLSHVPRLVFTSFGYPKTFLITPKYNCGALSLTSANQNYG